MSGCQRSPGSVNSSHRGELVGRPAMSTPKTSGSEPTRRVVPCRVQFAIPPAGKRVLGCLWRTELGVMCSSRPSGNVHLITGGSSDGLRPSRAVRSC